MALTTSQFIQPAGRLTTDLFPLSKEEREAGTTETQKLVGYLTAWITEAGGKTAALPAGDQDEAGRAWVYYRAYDAVYQRLLISPIEAKLDGQGEVRFTDAHAVRFRQLADEHLATFRSFVEASTTVSRPNAPRSFALTAHPRWYYDNGAEA